LGTQRLDRKAQTAVAGICAVFRFHAHNQHFFCLVLRTQLLSKVKESHTVDLAYLYYLPFCSVFTSKDNFHAQVVPLFLAPDRSFVNGIELKEDLKQLNGLYSALPEDVLKTGLSNFAHRPPEDTTYLTTRLWHKYLPGWRANLNKGSKTG